jgi:ribosomal protein L2
MLGRVCVRGRGCGNKRLVLNIDTFRRICQFGIISKFVYDFRRSAFVGCVMYMNGLISYIILTQDSLQLGKFLYSGHYTFNIKLEDC